MHRRKVPGIGLVTETLRESPAHGLEGEQWVQVRWIKRPSAWEGMERITSTYPVSYFRVYEEGDCRDGWGSND